MTARPQILYEHFKATMTSLGLRALPGYVVGVSGGPDSMALTHLLSCLAQEDGAHVHAVTVDHGLRPESGDEARQVGEWLANWPCVSHRILRWDGAKPGTRILEAARRARLDLLVSESKKMCIPHIVLAHHLDDQAETFLMRLAKGSGLDGLCAMAPVRQVGDVTLVRPLLDVGKEDLLSYCDTNKIPFVEDPSNRKETHLRPRLRAARQVLECEGLSASRLGSVARRLAHAREALDFYARAALEGAVRERSEEGVTLSLDVLGAHPAETRLRVVRLIVDDLTAGRDYPPRLEKLETIVAEAFATSPFRRRTLGGLVFSKDARKAALRVEREVSGGKNTQRNV